MTAIATLLVVLTISLLTVRVATVMLVLTGLSLPLARFQARSAFTGCGFTTGESEQIVGHPVRRRIISTLMLLGNAGIVTTVGTLIAGLLGTQSTVPLWARLTFLFVGVVCLWGVASSKLVERVINRWTFKLLKRYTSLEVRDYSSLMHLSGDYGIGELTIREGDWLADRALRDTKLTTEGVLVLGIDRKDGSYVGAPTADSEPRAGDTLIVYGSSERLTELDHRRRDASGQRKHVEAVADQKARQAGESERAARDQHERDDAHAKRRQAEEERDAIRKSADEIEDHDEEAMTKS
ncbi:MAG: TrkA C-terminal domain-containing protein [Planctomycetota bacterium]